jgi:hypothetical protein
MRKMEKGICFSKYLFPTQNLSSGAAIAGWQYAALLPAHTASTRGTVVRVCPSPVDSILPLVLLPRISVRFDMLR